MNHFVILKTRKTYHEVILVYSPPHRLGFNNIPLDLLLTSPCVLAPSPKPSRPVVCPGWACGWYSADVSPRILLITSPSCTAWYCSTSPPCKRHGLFYLVYSHCCRCTCAFRPNYIHRSYPQVLSTGPVHRSYPQVHSNSQPMPGDHCYPIYQETKPSNQGQRFYIIQRRTPCLSREVDNRVTHFILTCEANVMQPKRSVSQLCVGSSRSTDTKDGLFVILYKPSPRRCLLSSSPLQQSPPSANNSSSSWGSGVRAAAFEVSNLYY